FANWGANLTGGGDAERLPGIRVSTNAFQMLGVEPALVRLLLPSDGVPGADRVVVLSHGVWQRRFGGDARILGRPVLLNGVPYSVVGVLPQEFALPNAEVNVVSPLIFEPHTQRGAR